MAAKTPSRKRDQHDAKLAGEFRPRQEQPAIIEEAAGRKRDAAVQFRQRLENRVVPEQNLQQERHVADQFDVAAGELGDQPIARQPGDADDKAEHGREHDGDTGDQKRIEKSDPEGAAECRGAGGIIDQRLADVEARRIVPEAGSARRYSRARHFLRGIDDGRISDPADNRDEDCCRRYCRNGAAGAAGIGQPQPSVLATDINGDEDRQPAPARTALSAPAARIAGRLWSTTH